MSQNSSPTPPKSSSGDDDNLVDFSDYEDTELSIINGGKSKKGKYQKKQNDQESDDDKNKDDTDTEDDEMDDDADDDDDDDSDKEVNDVAEPSDDDEDDENKSDEEEGSNDANIVINKKSVKKNSKKSSKCIYDYLSDDDGVDVIFDDDIEMENRLVEKHERITKPILSNFERVRILGERSQQLTLGAKPMIKNVTGLSSIEITELEIKENIIPLIIERELPCGRRERWSIDELEK